MRNNLNGSAMIFTGQLAFHDFLVDFSCGCAGLTVKIFIDETLIMAKIQVGGNAIICNECFAMLQRGKKAGIYIVVGITFLHADTIAAGFEQTTNRSGSDTFSQR